MFEAKLLFSKVSEGFHRFPRRGGGVNLFQGRRVKMLISLETYRTYYFQGGWESDHISPLDPRTHSFFRVLSYFLSLKHTVPRSSCGVVDKILAL